MTEVHINHKIITWESDFLNEVNRPKQNKWSKKRNDYFSIEVIGGTKCFVKRTENGFEGSSLFKKLVGKNVSGIPKTYGFGEAIENNRKVQYLITEFLEGDTLDVVLNSGVRINNINFITNLVNSVSYLHSLGYWHSDINGDNIFISTSGQVYLIDIDSCVDNSIKPTHISNKEGALTTLSNQIGSYALKYYKKHLSESASFGYGSISGVILNYLQVLFLTYQLKYFQDQKVSNPTLFWKKSTFKGLNIEDEIRKINPQYADSLFRAALIKPLHKEVINKLGKEIISSSVNNAPDTTKLKKMKELHDLKLKYAQLEQLVASHTVERSKLIAERDDLRNKVTTAQKSSTSFWVWFWGIAASVATVIGMFTYSDASSSRDRYEDWYHQEQQEVQQLNSFVDELEESIGPYHVKEVTFINAKDKKEGTSFYNSSVTFIGITLKLFSLKEANIEVSFKRKLPSFYGYATYSDKVENQKNKYYIYKEVRLKQGINEVVFSGLGYEETGKWVVGPHEYTFYIDDNYFATKTLYIK